MDFKIVKTKIKNIIKDDTIILGCSTGPDSMVLLHLLLNTLHKDQIKIVYINHNVRKESSTEESFIKDYCKTNNLKLYPYSFIFNEQNFENEARMRRYLCFKEVAKQENAKYILTAHNADDEAETIIMRLIKKSSLKAYSGFNEISNFDDYILYRPLIEVSKEEILDYANKHNLKYFIDHTNLEDIHLRNRIRKYIIPQLLLENDKFYEAIKYYHDTLYEASKLVDNVTTEFIKTNVLVNNNDVTIKDIKLFNKQTNFLQKEILFKVLKSYNLSLMHIEEIKKIIKTNNKVITSFKNGLNIIKEYNYITFTSKNITSNNLYLEVFKDGIYELNDKITIEIKDLMIKFNNNDLTLWYNIPSLPVVIRNILPGDTIKRTKQNKNTKVYTLYSQKVCDVLKNKKIPFLERLNLYVVEQDGHILHILGLKIH